jgi:hypothetical protein
MALANAILQTCSRLLWCPLAMTRPLPLLESPDERDQRTMARRYGQVVTRPTSAHGSRVEA